MAKLKNNNIVKFVVTLFLVGIFIGIITNITFKPEITVYLEDFLLEVSNNRLNTFLLAIAIISGIFILSISLIGLPLILFYLFYEGFSIGFTLIAFTMTFGIKGFLFYLLYFIVIKLVFIICALYFAFMSTRFDIRLVNALIHKKREEVYGTFINQLYRYIIVLFCILINSTFIYFFANKIVSLFLPLIK